MSSKSNASPFLFRSEKTTLKSSSRSFDVSTPVTDGIAIINVEGETDFRLISANETFLTYKNSEEQDPIGRYVETLTWGDDSQENKLQYHLEKAYRSAAPLAFIWQFSVDKKSHNLLCKIIPLLSKEGVVAQITVSTSDYEDSGDLEIEVGKYTYTDTLTGLPNRSGFFENLDELFAQNQNKSNGRGPAANLEAAVLFINIRKLQRINESYGYDYGDKIILDVAKLLKTTVHENAKLARFTNDKFVVFLSEEHFGNVRQEANTLAESIHHHFATRALPEKSDIRVSVSIGIASGTASSEKIEQLMQNAHLAMKRNNDLAANQTIIFNQDIKTQAVTKLKLETEFREALEADALELHYQPLINLQSGLLSGFEALARWNTTTRGNVSPLEFIALAEEAGLIIPLGEWALETACGQLKSWIDDNPLASSLFMAVNISSSHIMMGNIAALTRDALAKSGLEGRNLKLELTESTIMENSDIARNILLDLKTLGISLAVDDFGTGYSSLSYLSRIPADTIKIDRSFVSKLDGDSEGASIIRVIINLAKSLGMTIIAEGIETESQMIKLREMGCHFGQGFLFSRAIRPEKVPDYIFEQPFKSLIK